jgi:hypothetical protein
MTVRPRLLGSALGLLLFATRLTAQTMPVPSLPAPSPESEATAAPTRPGPSPYLEAFETPGRPQPWEYAVALGAGWNSNIDFDAARLRSGASVTPQGGLARVFSSSHGQLRAAASGRWTEYPDDKDLRGYYGDFGLEGHYALRRTSVWGNASYGIGDSATSQILIEQGVALPRVKMRSQAGTLGLSRALGRWTSVRLDGRFYRTEFDSATFVDGESVRGGIGLERQLGARSTAGIGYSFEHTAAARPGGTYLTHYASLQWTRTLSRRSGLLLEAGGSYTPDAARAELEHEAGFFGGASFTRQVRRSTVILFVRREVAPAFGLGISRLTLRSGLRLNVPLGRNWGFRLDASHVQPQASTASPRLDATSDDAYVVLSRRLGARLGLSNEVRYRRGGATSRYPMVDAFQAGLSLTVLSSSGRAADLLR